MVRASWLLMSGVLVALLIAVPSTAYPSMNNYFNEDGPYDPENIEELINRIGNLIRLERKMESYKDYDIPNSKRTFDLGLGRGYTGTVQAKHLMGIAAANYAGGPGRRRRDAN